MKLFALLLVVLAAHTDAYKILGIFGLPSHSHNTLAKGIVDSLLKAGHEVTWATPFPEKVKLEPNLHIIDLSETYREFQKLMKDMDLTKPLNDPSLVLENAKNVSDIIANTKALRDVLVNQQFDAVINEWFFSDVEAGYAAIQQAPWILLSGMVMHPHLEGLVDEVRSVSTVPMMMFNAESSLPLSFWQRVKNVAIYALIGLYLLTKGSAAASRYEQHFGPLAAARGVTLPPFVEAKHNVSVLLVNSHPSISTAQVLPANIVEVAGYHISETTPPLPKDLQDILDSSKQGVVYFSMGSILKSEMLPEHTRKGLIQMFKELPYTVLWKFEEELPGLPKNVLIRSWFPQASVLAHPNVKLFISHGGQLSCLEAIHYGVPILAVPVFADQPNNAARAEVLGYAKKVPFSEHMVPELSAALTEMLANDGYFKRAKYLSKLFHNRPMSASSMVSHYVELAIESKGAYHLRSPSQLYAWYERWMLDLLAAALLLLYVIKTVLTMLYRSLFSKEAKKRKEKKH